MNKIIFLLLLGFFTSCKQKDLYVAEKRVAENIAKYIIDKDSLSPKRYSGEVFLHIYSKVLNDKNYRTYVTLNGLEPKSTEFKTEKTVISGFNILTYYSLNEQKLSIPSAFFVPDSKSWSFLSELYQNDIYLNELKPILEMNKVVIDKDNETDF